MFGDRSDDEDFAKFEKSPIYKKAMAIWVMAHRIAEIAAKTKSDIDFGGDRDILEDYAGYMMEDASKIAPKIAGAWGVQLYDLKMENASIIRKAARDLSVHMRALEMYGFKETEYCDLLRNEIEEFRPLFAEWVKTFDPWDYIIDRWGLFNPPGINYDDEAPDDNIPFNASEFLEHFSDESEEDKDDENDDEIEDEDSGQST